MKESLSATKNCTLMSRRLENIRKWYSWIRVEAEPHTLSVNGHFDRNPIVRTGAFMECGSLNVVSGYVAMGL